MVEATNVCFISTNWLLVQEDSLLNINVDKSIEDSFKNMFVTTFPSSHVKG
jgi:hypothetical protein